MLQLKHTNVQRGGGLLRPAAAVSAGPSSSRGPLPLRAAKETKERSPLESMSVSDLDIEGLVVGEPTTLTPEQEFVCRSSPAVEETIRAIARDIKQQRGFTMSRFSDAVSYSDPMRSFTGKAPYARMGFVKENVEGAKVSIKKMSMIDGKTASIDYVLTGSVSGQQVQIKLSDRLTINLLTGRVEQHRQSWEIAGNTSPGGSAAWTSARSVWSLKQKAQDLQDAAQKASEKNKEKEEANYTPTLDPTKFYQQNNKQDNNQNDMITYFGGLVVLYALYKAIEVVNSSGMN